MEAFQSRSDRVSRHFEAGFEARRSGSKRFRTDQDKLKRFEMDFEAPGSGSKRFEARESESKHMEAGWSG